MSLIHVRQALEIALFNIAPSIDIAWENNSYTPTVGVPWIRAVLMPATPENPTYGSDYHRLHGIFYIEFNYQKNTGSQAAVTRAELTKAVFKRSASFTNNGLTVVIERTPEIGQGSVIGDWFIIPWRARWYSEVFA